MIYWHRLLGLILTDFFEGSPWKVELEKDLSKKEQRLDLVILKKEDGEFSGELPDGLENLKDLNLITYKSMSEALDR